MPFRPNPSTLAYSENAGISSLAKGTYLLNGDPSTTTLNGPNGPFVLGDRILNTTNGNLWYLSAITVSSGLTSATWTLLQISGGTSSVLPVANGGTGDSSLTAHGVLIGEGTSAVNVTSAGTSGQALVSGGASADPAFGITGVVGGGTGVATLTGLALGSGTSAFTGVTYTAVTAFTPAILINGSATGITYGSRAAFYQQIGSLVFVAGTIVLTSKGASTGAVTLSGLPVASGTNGANYTLNVQFGVVTFSANYTGGFVQVGASGTAGTFLETGSGQTAQTLTDAAIANTSAFYFNGFYGIN